MKRALVILLGLCLIVLGGYLFAPLFGPLTSEATVSESLLRGAWLLVLVPLGLFYFAHPTSHLDKRQKERVDLFLGCGGLAAIGALILVGSHIYVYGAVSVFLSFVFLYFARKLWCQAIPNPRQVIVETGERILAEEKDPAEKRKFASALERFKKG